jgi:hypothetical protein
MFDVKSLKLPHLALPRLPRLPVLQNRLPFFGRGVSSDEDEEYEAYEAYPAADFGDEDAGSFAPSRSPFGAAAPVRRPARSRDGDAEEVEEELGFDYRPAAYDDDEHAYQAPGTEAEDFDGNEGGDEDDEDDDEEEEGDVNDMLAFFEKAPEVSKVPEAIREGLEHVSAVELLADAREISALLRRTNRS